MIELLCPDQCVRSVLDIDLPALRARGIIGLIVDLDNTLVAWEAQFVSDAMRRWVEQAQEFGFRLCIASNGRRQRVAALAARLSIPAVEKATKPRKRPFKRALALLGTSPQQTAVIGDQIFTDILGGNRMGLYTVLINPMSPTELYTTRLVRRVERRVLARLSRKGYLPHDALKTRWKGPPSDGEGARGRLLL
ncbi:MAG TPA: YqeG family HAD IIIA-type phosphatase [Limnochordia bacterium]